MRGQRGRGYGVFLSIGVTAGVLLLSALTWAAGDLMPNRWDATSGQAAATEMLPTNLDAALQEAADVARLSVGCVPAEDALPDVIPAEMVLRQPGGTIERVAWTYPAPVGSWVWALCYAA